MSFTVTATQGGSKGLGMSMSVLVFTGQAATQNGQTGGHQSTTASVQVVPNATGSYIVGAILGLSGTYTAEAGTTILQNGSLNALRYLQFRDTNTGSSGVAETVGSTNTTNGISIVAAEILASGTLTIDPSTPAATAVVNAEVITCAPFTPPSGSLLVAAVSSNGGTVVTMALSDTSGLGLAWTEQVKSNVSGDGYTGVWLAQIPASNPSVPGPAGTGTQPTYAAAMVAASVT